MRLMRFALGALVVLMVVFAATSAFAQQQTQQQTEQQAQEQQQQQRQGRGGQGGGQGQGRGGQGDGQAQGQGGGQGRGGQPAVPEPPSPGIENYANTDDMFSLSVPCKFAASSITWESEYGSKLPGNVYSCKNGADEYSMTVINYTDIVKIRAAQEDRKSVV